MGAEYDRRGLCIKEKEVPYVVAGCVRDRTRKTQRNDPYITPRVDA